MLDTNTLSYIARGRSLESRRLLKETQQSTRVYLSAVTEGEILYELAKRPDAVNLTHAMYAVLDGLEVLPWTSVAASVYGAMRAENERRGTLAGNLDMLIAAHAVSVGAVLVTDDGPIQRLFGGPDTVNWANDLRMS